jgi:hypothetical protein
VIASVAIRAHRRDETDPCCRGWVFACRCTSGKHLNACFSATQRTRSGRGTLTSCWP